MMNMVHQVGEEFYLGLVSVVVVWAGLLGIMSFFTNWRRWKLPAHHTALLSLATAAAAAGAAFWRGIQLAMPLDQIIEHGAAAKSPEALMESIRTLVAVPLTAVFVFEALPFLIHLYLKWTGRILTEEERAGGVEGIRAWLSPRHVGWVILIALFGWLGLGWPFLLLLAGGFGLLLVFPAVTAGGPVAGRGTVSGTRDPQLSEERRRVLTMLQEGKISVEESAELLYALGEPVAARADVPEGASRSRTMLAVGAFIVLVGFFLPWFSFSMEGIGLSAPMPENMPVPLRELWAQSQNTLGEITDSTFTYSGLDVRNGLGWTILLLASGAAALPFLSVPADAKTRRSLMLVLLAAGVFLMIFVTHNSIRLASYGLLVVVAGYFLEFIGAIWEFRAQRAEQPAHEAATTTT